MGENVIWRKRVIKQQGWVELMTSCQSINPLFTQFFNTMENSKIPAMLVIWKEIPF